jgi:hypothetical protein
MNFIATPQELLAVMDKKNIQTMVNLTGGSSAAAVREVDRALRQGRARPLPEFRRAELAPASRSRGTRRRRPKSSRRPSRPAPGA